MFALSLFLLFINNVKPFINNDYSELSSEVTHSRNARVPVRFERRCVLLSKAGQYVRGLFSLVKNDFKRDFVHCVLELLLPT